MKEANSEIILIKKPFHTEGESIIIQGEDGEKLEHIFKKLTKKPLKPSDGRLTSPRLDLNILKINNARYYVTTTDLVQGYNIDNKHREELAKLLLKYIE